MNTIRRERLRTLKEREEKGSPSIRSRRVREYTTLMLPKDSLTA